MLDRKNENEQKKEIGGRFAHIRQQIQMTQQRLAEELLVYQSTVASIEVGKTFPSCRYLAYLHDEYGANINWLLTGQGKEFSRSYKAQPLASEIRQQFSDYLVDKDTRYHELLDLMEIPLVEEVILAKALELRTLLKDEVTARAQTKEEEKLRNQ